MKKPKKPLIKKGKPYTGDNFKYPPYTNESKNPMFTFGFWMRPNRLVPEIKVSKLKPDIPCPGECRIVIGQDDPSVDKKSQKAVGKKSVTFTFDSALMYDLLRLARAGNHIMRDWTEKERKRVLTKMFDSHNASAIIDTIMDSVYREVKRADKLDTLKPRSKWVGRHPTMATQPDVVIQEDETTFKKRKSRTNKGVSDEKND